MIRRALYCVVGLVSVLTVDRLSAADSNPLRDAVECQVRDGLPNVFAKLRAGKKVRIAYLGGSITAQPGWRPKTLVWFQKQFPKAKVEEINAAIGGTGSNLGVFRLQHDVLQFKPDLLFVEFAVNDGGTAPAQIHRAMEGIVRQTWRANPATDICYVYTLTQSMLKDLQSDKFPRAASAMEVLADYYRIPSIHMGMEVAKLEKSGELVFKTTRPKTGKSGRLPDGRIPFSPDGVHPYPDTGHEIYLQVVARSLRAMEAVGHPGPHSLRRPMVADNWENAKMIPLDQARLSDGWVKLPADNTLVRRFGKRMPAIWRAERPGQTVSFRFKGSYAGFYDLLGPDCGQVAVQLDHGDPVIKRRFDGYCSYHRLSMLVIGSGLPDGVHSLTATIDPQQPDKAKILQTPRLSDFKQHPEKYDGTKWYVGAIMLIGEMVP